MSDSTDVHQPSERAVATIQECRELLGVDTGWDLWLHEADNPGNNENADGECEFQGRYLKATITIRRGLSAERERAVILHELMHVVLAPLSLANDRIMDLIQKHLHEHVGALYCDAEEQVIERLTRALASVNPSKKEAE